MHGWYYYYHLALWCYIATNWAGLAVHNAGNCLLSYFGMLYSYIYLCDFNMYLSTVHGTGLYNNYT